MNDIALQISPEAKSAYYADYLSVAQQELTQVLGEIPFRYMKTGPLEFIQLAENAADPETLLSLSFAQGLYRVEGDLLRPLELTNEFHLHEDFVFGSKYRGKTNERLTQMLINIGLAVIGAKASNNIKLLDPMCGRATTLLWALRYGLQAKGIEQDAAALTDIHRHLKKWTKLHKQKHQLSEGFIGGGKKKNLGKFLEFSTPISNMRIINGDSRLADQLIVKEKFDLLVCDLPYGVQHRTTDKTRDPLAVIEESIAAWKNCMKKKSAMVLAFNRNNPKRDTLIEAFAAQGLQALPFSAPHRMSESIVRDVVVFVPGN
ncbi:MAG: hypothetical protein OEZ68_03115 [Gammaproteobacteria bacterium]|nr:hypothetical protein [Gammaproteobacteria bacterium]MDH5799773.1 hypothetical protein [Gammaproteobacteria bacterium]